VSLRRISGLVVVVLVLLAMPACADEPVQDARSSVTVAGVQITRDDPATDGRFVVGVLLAQSGPLAAADGRVLAGLQAELTSLQSRGVTSPGGAVVLDVVDTKSDLRLATEAAGKLLDRGADLSSSAAIPTSPATRRRPRCAACVVLAIHQ
jgi:hypothetical protein